MKLEVKMYVRTRYGYIARLKRINKTDRYTEYEFDNTIGYDYDGFFHSIVEDCIDGIEIIKASYNIIDLIEVGDVITFKNDEDVYKINCVPNEESTCDCFYLVFDYATQYGLEDIEVSKETMLNTLESVITREQFSQMEYKVGD